jgi:hypothetical protein
MILPSLSGHRAPAENNYHGPLCTLQYLSAGSALIVNATCP